MKRKKLVWILTAFFVLTAFSGCGEKKEEDHTANQSKEADVAYISDSEAEIYFYEITSTYRFELMTMDPEQLKAGANPEYWSGIAPETAELSFDELTDAYINEEERSLLSTAYGSNIANIRFGIYSIAELQKVWMNFLAKANMMFPPGTTAMLISYQKIFSAQPPVFSFFPKPSPSALTTKSTK